MNPRRLAALAMLLTLSGCATWERVEQARADAPDKSYQVTLPQGWVRFMQDTDGIAVTRDGFALNRIHIRRHALDKAFPRLKKPASADLLPSELAELQIAETKTAAGETVVSVRDNAPALVDGRPGYRLRLQYRNDRGLVFDRVIYGLVTPKGYYTLTFNAPALHYAARDLPAFEQVVASFKLEARQRE